MTGVVELPIAVHGHLAKLRASPLAEGAWDVCTVIDGDEVAHRRCADWEHVERFRSLVQRRVRADAVGVTDLAGSWVT